MKRHALSQTVIKLHRKRGHALSLIVIKNLICREARRSRRTYNLLKILTYDYFLSVFFRICLPGFQPSRQQSTYERGQVLSRIVIETEYVERPGALVTEFIGHFLGEKSVTPHSAIFFFLCFQDPCVPGFQSSRQQSVYEERPCALMNSHRKPNV
jgi:hypothetical protein